MFYKGLFYQTEYFNQNYNISNISLTKKCITLVEYVK